MKITLRGRTAVLLATICFVGCAPRERLLEENVWSPQTKEYIRTRKGALKAGRKQEMSISYTSPVETVVGKIGAIDIPFKKETEDGKLWTAEFKVPRYEDLGEIKVLRVYAKSIDGLSPPSNLYERIPASWLGRGPDGKFPAIPGPEYDEYPIEK